MSKAQEKMLETVQAVLGYSDHDMAAFKANPRNLKFLERVPDLFSTRFRLKVIQSHGCACGHRTGQEVVINGDGALAAAGNPDRVCIYLLQAAVPLIFGAQEFAAAGMDPNQMNFRQAGCFDTGLSCGGLGNVKVELHADTPGS